VISLPAVTETQVHQTLNECDYAPTNTVTETGRYWKHKKVRRHLLVPFSNGGFYPDWMLQDLVQRARAIYDEECATAIESINPWERLRAKRDKPKPKPRPIT
jgi:hypothetical protein